MTGQIWITGDTHGDATRFNTSAFPEQKTMTKNDALIILGDFGLLWNYNGESKEEKYWLDWLNDRPFTTLFIDGNHECFPRLFALPEEEHFGAPIGVVRPSVFYLKRGNIYDINGLKTFTFGGASSHDISEGIINLDGKDPDWKKTREKWSREGRRFFRVNGVSWWPDEVEQDPAVYQRGLDNLAAVGNEVDLILTHCCCTQTENAMGFYNHDRMSEYLQQVHDKVHFHDWFFGHYHMNRTVFPHEYCLYEQLVRVQ